MPLLPSFHKFLTFFFSPPSIQGVCRGAALSQGFQDQAATKGRTQGELSSCMGIGVACLLLLNQSVSELYLFIVFIPTARDIRRLFASWKNPRKKENCRIYERFQKRQKEGNRRMFFLRMRHAQRPHTVNLGNEANQAVDRQLVFPPIKKKTFETNHAAHAARKEFVEMVE